MSHFQIGWAEYSLTPDKKVSLVGQFAERISEYVEKPLCVTAMAVSTDSDQAVFCSCDLVGVSWSLRDAVREKLRDIRDAQNHLAKNALRLVTRLSELLQHCQFVLQQQTDQRLRQLTVLSAIFMPLTLITGVYGMNFAYMPETGWRYGYYATLAGMVWLAIFLWITLKRKGWFR